MNDHKYNIANRYPDTKEEKKYYQCLNCYGITSPFFSTCPFCGEWGNWKPVKEPKENNLSTKK